MDNIEAFAQILGLFKSTHKRGPVHDRELRHWINSPDGQAILAEHGIEWHAKTDEEIAEEDEAEESTPREILINTIAAVIGLSDRDKREAVLRAIDQWEQSIGDERAVFVWPATEPDAAGELLRELISSIHSACLPKETMKHSPVRLVVPPDTDGT